MQPTDYLELCVNATWMAVCDYSGMWTPQDAAVACRQQGKSAMGELVGLTTTEAGRGV